MLRYILLCMLLPNYLFAQEPVKPVLSQDYLTLINNDSAVSSNIVIKDAGKQHWLLTDSFASATVKKVRFGNSSVTIVPVRKKTLTLGGNYTFGAALSAINAMPALQNNYVQGRSLNGALAWQGAETGDILSYGPALNMLEYDGTAYPYDVNGRLVSRGSGNGKAATGYNNNILRTGGRVSHSFSLLGSIKHDYWQPDWSFALKGFIANEATVVKENNNSNRDFSASVEKQLKPFALSASYHYFTSSFSNDNSNGFLNRVYQNSLLTPVSFNNAQNTLAYSSNADNPLVQLHNNGHTLKRIQQTGNIGLQFKPRNLIANIMYAADAVDQNSDQSLKAGSAFFPGGLLYTRVQADRNQVFSAFGNYFIRYGSYKFRSDIKFNYAHNDARTSVNYAAAGSSYRYHRFANDASLSYNSTFDGRALSLGLNMGDKLYQSNTTPVAKAFLPDVSGFVRLSRSWDNPFDIKLSATHTTFYNEPAVNASYRYSLLTQLQPAQAAMYMPVTELANINNINAVKHNELTSRLEIGFKYHVTLSAEYFNRQSTGDVFPVFNNGQLLLHNAADTRLRGWEILLELNNLIRHTKIFSMSHSFSFYTAKNMVTHVYNGYSNIALAGFANVHKALVEGQPVGVIVGSTYQRDNAGRIMIGNDGFPLVNNQLSVIANPTPKFTIKSSHQFNIKAFTINLDLGYQKGGERWNGTQAILDYTGRSKTSGIERSIAGYVFDGVALNGAHNNIAVSYYNPALPVEANRWVRYGYTGVAEAYIQKADAFRIHNMSVAYTMPFKKYVQRIRFTAYAENLMLWSAYKGADPTQLMYDQAAAEGLDFFNLPSVKNIGLNVSVQF